LEGFFFP